jgi:hypothetical protein
VKDDAAFVLLLTGAAGGGKSWLAAQKLHHYCLDHPGTMALALRKTRESMRNSTVLFLWRKIVGKAARHIQNAHRFEYPNGSILAYGGMKDEEQREQVRSIGQDGGVDIIWLEEATAFDEEDFNELIARTRGKAGPYRQIVLTTNPDAPTHWIYNRLILGGEATVYYSSAADNPHNPAEYLDNLQKLTGTEGERLASGKWVQASGLVYDVWSDGPDGGNVTDAADYVPGAGIVLWSVDDGYSGARDASTGYYTAASHPRVFLLAQLRHDGTIAVFEEHYAVQTLSEAQIADVRALPYPVPDYAVVDSSAAELRGRLRDADIANYGGTHEVEEGIKELRRRLAPDINGRRGLLVHPRCRHLRAEMASYRRDDRGKPVKAFDHGPDAARMLCWKLRYE